MHPERPDPAQKIPEQASRVFTGVLFDVYQWQQTMFDGTTKTFEFLVRKDAVTVLPITESGMMVLQTEVQPGREPFLTLPGGGWEEGESLEMAARRELLEETGYESQTCEPWFSYQVYGKADYVDHVFIARGCRRVREPEWDGGEHIVVHECTFDDFCTKVLDESFRNKELSIRVARMLIQGKKEELRKELTDK